MHKDRNKNCNELYHYGVVGMKWGVRRYQNYDGTRILKGFTPKVSNAEIEYYTEPGSYKGYSSASPSSRQSLASSFKKEDAIITKGTKANRITGTKDEPVDLKRKYISFTDSDLSKYLNPYSHLGLGNSAYLDKYVITKDSKIAGMDTAFKEALSATGYADKKIKDLYSKANTSSKYMQNKYKAQVKGMLKEYGNTTISNLYESLDKEITYKHNNKIGKETTENIIRNVSYISDIGYKNDMQDKYFNSLKSKGYDFVIDQLDAKDDYSYPVIALSPRDSLQKTSSKRILDLTKESEKVSKSVKAKRAKGF